MASPAVFVVNVTSPTRQSACSASPVQRADPCVGRSAAASWLPAQARHTAKPVRGQTVESLVAFQLGRVVSLADERTIGRRNPVAPIAHLDPLQPAAVQKHLHRIGLRVQRVPVRRAVASHRACRHQTQVRAAERRSLNQLLRGRYDGRNDAGGTDQLRRGRRQRPDAHLRRIRRHRAGPIAAKEPSATAAETARATATAARV